MEQTVNQRNISHAGAARALKKQEYDYGGKKQLGLGFIFEKYWQALIVHIAIENTGGRIFRLLSAPALRYFPGLPGGGWLYALISHNYNRFRRAQTKIKKL